MVAGEPGSRGGPSDHSTLQLAPTTSWPRSQPGKRWNGVFLSVFSGRKRSPLESTPSAIFDAQYERGQNRHWAWRVKVFMGQA